MLKTKKQNLIYPEISYELVGLAFDVFNKLGYGFQEKYYQRAFAKEMDKLNIKYKKEKSVNIQYEKDILGRYLLDFLVENKIAVELETRPRFGYIDIKQVLNYLKVGDYKLALIIYFTSSGVKYRRVVNSYII